MLNAQLRSCATLTRLPSPIRLRQERYRIGVSFVRLSSGSMHIISKNRSKPILNYAKFLHDFPSPYSHSMVPGGLLVTS